MNAGKNGNKTKGVHHVGLTVRRLDEARQFFVNTLGYEQVGEIPDYPAVFLSDDNTMITLWQAEDPTKAVSFNRKSVIGLHHLALSVDSEEALDALCERLKVTNDVEIEFEPEDLLGGPVRHMICSMPGSGIRIEFIAA